MEDNGSLNCAAIERPHRDNRYTARCQSLLRLVFIYRDVRSMATHPNESSAASDSLVTLPNSGEDDDLFEAPLHWPSSLADLG